MRARIAAANLGTAVGALLLAGVATAVLVRVSASREAEDRVRDRAEALAAALVPVEGRRTAGPRSPGLERLAEGLGVEALEVVVVTEEGGVRGDLPVGVEAGDPLAAASAGASTSGRRDGRVWAAAPIAGAVPARPGGGPATPTLEGATAVVVASDPATPSSSPVLGVFLWVALGTVVVGAAVSAVLSRGLTGPLRRAEEATGRIAAGDLSARVPEPGPGTAPELADLARAINAMAEGLERSRGLERQFLLSVSHDLRTPLTSIRGWSEAIADGAAPDAARAAGIIGAEAARLDRLVGDLLDLARLEARRFGFVPVEVEAGSLVGDVVAGLGPDAAGAGLALRLDDRSAGRRALVDPDRLGQVVANLVENALKYAATQVVVAVEATGAAEGGAAPGIAVTVTDDGPGIAAEDLPHVFERLYVARRRPPRRESGSGLGLAIVRELVTAMGGAVTARSPAGPEGGTTLRIDLPAAPAELSPR